tara:strand:- start:728 stop:1255 length:528 start_codon:yes stop_codon:yes gene_type:complete
MRLHFFGFILNLLAIRAIGIKKFYTYELKSQYNANIEWKEYTHILVCTKATNSLGKEWGDKLMNKGIKQDSICVVAPIPKWMTKTPGSKNIIQTSIAHLEKNVPVFIDWEEKLVIANKINDYPTIILVAKDNRGNLSEIGRASGKYTDNKCNNLRKESNNSSPKIFRLFQMGLDN